MGWVLVSIEVIHMAMKPINHYPLNTKQLHILKLTYKFRFITAPLMARYLGLKSRHSMYEALERLVDRKYLGKRVDGNEGLLIEVPDIT